MPSGGGSPPRKGMPPAGWQIPRSADESGRRSELELLVQMVASLRELVPPELQRRLTEALRELLLALRALIDWYLERSERSDRRGRRWRTSRSCRRPRSRRLAPTIDSVARRDRTVEHAVGARPPGGRGRALGAW